MPTHPRDAHPDTHHTLAGERTPLDAALSAAGLSRAELDDALRTHDTRTRPRLERLWAYYRNPMRPAASVSGALGGSSRDQRRYTLAQEDGLPARLTGRGTVNPWLLRDDRAAGRKEVVIENDIAWRIATMVDFLFGRPVQVRSTARDQRLRRAADLFLAALWHRSGGVSLLQDFATLGHVYGHVDLLLRMDALGLRDLAGAQVEDDEDRALRAAELMRVEVVEPTRAVALTSPHDWRRVLAFVVAPEAISTGSHRAEPEPAGVFGSVLRRIAGTQTHAEGPERALEVITPGAWLHVRGRRVLASQDLDLTLGQVPVAHVQNQSLPLEWSGLSEVEPLIPMQDELNTRLSDRASRVTLQSFQMYLAKGIEGLDKVGIGPGQVWTTDNQDASIEAFGGDANCPSEAEHIREVREALDKISGVPPVAAGVVQARIGNLSSATALRITLMTLLSKTQRKRIAYGGAMERIAELALTALDASGVMPLADADRRVELVWQDPLPVDEPRQAS